MPTIYSSCGDELRDIAEQNEMPAYLDYEAYEGGENEHLRGNYVRQFGRSLSELAEKLTKYANRYPYQGAPQITVSVEDDALRADRA